MSYVPVSPLPSDFCGRPPCGLCYIWKDDRGISPAVVGIAWELLRVDYQTLDRQQKRQLHSISLQAHKGTLIPSPAPPSELPPAPEAIDLSGWDSERSMNAWLKERRVIATPPPRQLTVDEIAVRQEQREATQKAKEAKLKALREEIGVITNALKEPSKPTPPSMPPVPDAFLQSVQNSIRPVYKPPAGIDFLASRGIPQGFIEEGRARGLRDSEIYERWNRNRGPRYDYGLSNLASSGNRFTDWNG